MRDTRLLQVREMAKDCHRILDEMTDENIDSFRDHKHLMDGLRAAAALIEAMSIYEEELCGATSCIGSVCAKPASHSGTHRSKHSAVEWTDESDRAYANSIAKSMNGRRD